MIDKLLNIVKLVIAMCIVLGLIATGFMILLLLLGIAMVAGAVYWVKQQSFLKGKDASVSRYAAAASSAKQGSAYTPQEHITVIEGEAEEVMPDHAASVKKHQVR